TVLRFLSAFDLGQTESACKQLTGRFLAQLTGGGLEGCKLYLRRDGSSRRIGYSISISHRRPHRREGILNINPPGPREVELRYEGITVLEHGISRIDSLAPIDNAPPGP